MTEVAVLENLDARRFGAVRTGILAGAWSVAGSFQRGLLPRSATDQALVTGIVAAFHIGAGALSHSLTAATTELLGTRFRSLRPDALNLLSAGVVAGGSAAVLAAIPEDHDHPMPAQIARAVALKTSGGAVAFATVIGSDLVIDRMIGRQQRHPWLEILGAASIGTAVAGVSVLQRDRRADELGIPDEDRIQIVATGGPLGIAKAVGLGVAGGAGLLAIAAGEWLVAEGTSALVGRLMGRPGPVTPLVGHLAAATLMSAAATWGLGQVRVRLERGDDIVEPAYPEPPTSPNVTAGPSSGVAFDAIGKEGRRFVLMALTPEQITAVMGEPAVAPVRAVAGYDSTPDLEERAQIAVDELERLGGFERSVIVVAAPTGVGYVNYVYTEALEYLTRGDCAVVVPQYALVPSALALNVTGRAVRLQTRVLELVAERIAGMPADRRPRLWQFGESLGAQVALDVIADGTLRDLASMGVERGLYLGTPFRTRLWKRWLADPDAVDAEGALALVAQPADLGLPNELGRPTSRDARHLMVVHHDDPVNKFEYETVVRPPWWLGPPETRPPLVPRETRYRPVTTFVIGLIDLKNGMNSKPGSFVRQGHDYRIDAREALEAVFGLSSTPDQAERIEAALRSTEQEWAMRRMVARRFDGARKAVLAQLKQWGVSADQVQLPDVDVDQVTRSLGTSGPV